MRSSLNYIALNQEVFHKLLCVGTGFVGDSEIGPLTDENNLHFYVNGLHANFPDIGDVDTAYTLGSVFAEEMMMGMPGESGKMSYLLLENDHYFALLIELTLGDEDEAAQGIAVIADRTQFTTEAADSISLTSLIEAMLMQHLKRMFFNYYVHEVHDRLEIANDPEGMLKRVFERC
jgi:hypothetical protein